MIRSSKHSTKFTNTNKRNELQQFIALYRLTLQNIIDYLWINKIITNNKVLNIQNNQLYCPSLLNNDFLKQFNQFNFTQRMLQCIGKQACSMINAAIIKRKKQLFMLNKLQKENKPTKHLQRQIDIHPLVKPNALFAKPELDSRFISFYENRTTFDLFVRLSCIYSNKIKNDYTKIPNEIRIPIKHTKVSNKWLNKTNYKSSIRISKDFLYLFYEYEPEASVGTKTIGADQGMTTCLTLSDGQTTGKCPHGHDLSSILEDLRHGNQKRKNGTKRKAFRAKRSGSRNFKKKQTHRSNYINWSINQLDFSKIKELRLEKIQSIRKGKKNRSNRNNWTYTEIKKKLEMICEEKGIIFKEVPNEYNSQRCNKCGLVRKSSRKGKTFICTGCGNTADSDLNAASNLEINLYQIAFSEKKMLRSRRMNDSGFYWKPKGLFDLTGERIVSWTEEIGSVE